MRQVDRERLEFVYFLLLLPRNTIKKAEKRGRKPLFFVSNIAVATEDQIRQIVEEKISDDQFIVSLSSNASNDFVLEMDGLNGFGIDDCTALHRHIRFELGEEAEDMGLQVSSAGLDKPLRHPLQFEKNVGRTVQVLLNDNERFEGELVEAQPESITIRYKERVKEGKRKKTVETQKLLNHSDIRETKIVIRF